MKKKLYLVFLLGTAFVLGKPSFAAPSKTYVKTRVVLTEGGNRLLRRSIETTLTIIIQEINKKAAGVGSLETIRQYCTEGGFLSIRDLAEYDRIYSIMPEFRAKLLNTIPGYFEVRDIKVNLGTRSGKVIFEYLVFTLDSNGMIVDLDYALEQHQYEDIIQFGKNVSDESQRRLILKFIERYRTAYNRKDLSYLEKVFSDHALIIVGIGVQESKQSGDFFTEHTLLGPQEVKLIIKSKREYLDALRERVFRRNRWINVKFAKIEVIQHDSIPDIYGAMIIQEWTAELYNDKGYLFLLFDFQNKAQPIIHVRAWQSRSFDDGSYMGLYDFKFARGNNH